MAFEVTVRSGGGGGKGDFKALDDGNYPAVLIGVIDLGTRDERFGDEDARPVHKVLLAWEVIGEHRPGSKDHHVIGRDYTLTLNEKGHLAGVVKGMGVKLPAPGEKLNLEAMVGRPCLLSVEKRTAQASGREYNRVDKVAPPVRGMNIARPQNDPLVWQIEEGAVLPEHPWLPFVYGRPCQELIRESHEWRALQGQGDDPAPVFPGDTVDPKNIPF